MTKILPFRTACIPPSPLVSSPPHAPLCLWTPAKWTSFHLLSHTIFPSILRPVYFCPVHSRSSFALLTPTQPLHVIPQRAAFSDLPDYTPRKPGSVLCRASQHWIFTYSCVILCLPLSSSPLEDVYV